jgi:hypothetical protein
VNKWWVRFWGFVALAALSALIATSARPEELMRAGSAGPIVPSARRVNDRPITPNTAVALSAAMAFFRTPDEDFIERRLAAAHARLTEAARTEPEALRAADLLPKELPPVIRRRIPRDGSVPPPPPPEMPQLVPR